jgi:hypothetical protein
MNCCDYAPWGFIHNTSFLMYLKNRSTKLECLSLANLATLVSWNTLAYFYVMKEMKYCEYGPWSRINNVSFLT